MAKLTFPGMRTPSADPEQNRGLLRTIKEALEQHQRLRGDDLKSFVRLEELIKLGLADQYGNLYPPSVTGIGAAGSAVGAFNDLTDVDTNTLAPRKGDELIYDGTNWVPMSPRNYHYFFDDFIFTPAGTAGEGGWDANISGTGAIISGYAGDNIVGAVGLFTGTTTTGQAGVARSNNATVAAVTGYKLNPGPGNLIFRARVRFTSVGIPTAAQDAIMRVGLMDEISGAPGNGVYLSTDFANQGDARFFGVARDGTLNYVTTTSTQIPVAGTYYLLEFRYTSASNTVEFFVNGTSIGSTTANIPTAALAIAVQIQKTAGTTGLGIDVDYVEVIQNITRL